MSNKNIYEVFNEFKEAKTKKDRIDVLRNNDTFALRNVLVGTLHPNIEFVFNKDNLPEWKRVDVPPGMAYNHMTEALGKMYLFMKNNARAPVGLTDKRRVELFIQLLEGLEPLEADVYVNIILKDQKIPYLTLALVNEAFPELQLPQS
jgi:hypothetical protein